MSVMSVMAQHIYAHTREFLQICKFEKKRTFAGAWYVAVQLTLLTSGVLAFSGSREMSIETLLSRAEAAGFNVALVGGDQLRVTGGQKGAPIVAELKVAKTEILALLRSRQAAKASSFTKLLSGLDADARYALEERAAIMADSDIENAEALAIARTQKRRKAIWITYYTGERIAIPQEVKPADWRCPF